MTVKKQPPELSVEERRAVKVARFHARRAARGYGPDGVLRYDTSCCPPSGPVYTISGASAARNPGGAR